MLMYILLTKRKCIFIYRQHHQCAREFIWPSLYLSIGPYQDVSRYSQWADEYTFLPVGQHMCIHRGMLLISSSLLLLAHLPRPVWLGLFPVFNNISTFLGYLIPKPSLKKNSSYSTYWLENRRAHTISNVVGSKVNIIRDSCSNSIITMSQSFKLATKWREYTSHWVS